MPDGSFNGVEVLWIAGIIMLACLTLYAARRASRSARGSELTAEPEMDAILASLWTGDLAWPRGTE